MTNISVPMKKISTLRFAKTQSPKKGDDSSETCSNNVPFEGDLPLVGNIVLESSRPPSARTRSSRCSTAGKSRPTTPWLSDDAPLSNKTQGSKRKTSSPPTSTTIERRVCYL